MEIPPANLGWFAQNFEQAAERVLQAWDDADLGTPADEPTADLLCGAMEQLISLLQSSESDHGPLAPSASLTSESPDISEMGDYGLNILEELAVLSEDLGIGDDQQIWEMLAVSLARWIIYQGGELSTLGGIVNGLAYIANHSEDTGDLEALYSLMTDMIEATSSLAQQQSDETHQQNPWHVLLLNRGIIATRIMSPRLMDTAYSDIAQLIPEQASNFFREGMEQLELINYPHQVREIIEKYFNDWPTQRVLH